MMKNSENTIAMIGLLKDEGKKLSPLETLSYFGDHDTDGIPKLSLSEMSNEQILTESSNSLHHDSEFIFGESLMRRSRRKK